MKRIMIGTLAAAGVTIIAAGAFAAQGPGERWESADANGDGEISAAEMSARQAEFLAAADTDGNGAISKDEMKAYHQARRAERRAQMDPDKNGDGVVDRTEFLNAAQDRFDRMDKDDNGVLSEDEQRRNRGRHHRRGKDRG